MCKGTITRKRETTLRTEQSSIDHVLVSNDLGKLVKSVIIDEEQNYALTRINKTKEGVTIKRSDHNTIITEFRIEWNKSVKHNKVEFLNFKNVKCQTKVKQITSTGTYLSSSFDGNESLNTKTNIFI